MQHRRVVPLLHYPHLFCSPTPYSPGLASSFQSLSFSEKRTQSFWLRLEGNAVCPKPGSRGSHLGLRKLGFQGLHPGRKATSEKDRGWDGSAPQTSGVSVLRQWLVGEKPPGCKGPSQPPGVALQAVGRWAGAARVTAAGPGGWGLGGAAAPAVREGGGGGGGSRESGARGGAPGSQRSGSRKGRAARASGAAAQSPRGAAQRGRWDRPDLPPRRPAPRRPRPLLLPSLVAPAGAAPESGATCPGPGSRAARRPANPPSESPARGPAGGGVAGQAGRGWTGRGGGRGRKGGSAGGAGALPQLFSGAAHLVPVPLSWGSESGGEGAARS